MNHSLEKVRNIRSLQCLLMVPCSGAYHGHMILIVLQLTNVQWKAEQHYDKFLERKLFEQLPDVVQFLPLKKLAPDDRRH